MADFYCMMGFVNGGCPGGMMRTGIIIIGFGCYDGGGRAMVGMLCHYSSDGDGDLWQDVC